ncbi:DNA translocase FtsK [Chryseobacterium sp. StRB126]|nr:DNA translocase FtsK [Chryseobacterium sp. StRB126]
MLPVSYQVRSIIGLILLAVYAFGAYTLIYRPIASENKLKRHLFIRLGILSLFLLIAIFSQWFLKEQNTNWGTGYMLYLVMIVLGYATLIYTIVESIVLYTKKKYEQTAINLALAFAIYCFIIFSGLFGF